VSTETRSLGPKAAATVSRSRPNASAYADPITSSTEEVPPRMTSPNVCKLVRVHQVFRAAIREPSSRPRQTESGARVAKVAEYGAIGVDSPTSPCPAEITQSRTSQPPRRHVSTPRATARQCCPLYRRPAGTREPHNATRDRQVSKRSSSVPSTDRSRSSGVGCAVLRSLHDARRSS
jgi:hypothetical protein